MKVVSPVGGMDEGGRLLWVFHLPHSRSCSITPWGRTVEHVLGTGAVWSMCQPSQVGTVLEQAAVSSAKTEDGGVLAPCWSRQLCPELRWKMVVCWHRVGADSRVQC